MKKIKIIIITTIIVFPLYLFGAYLENTPLTITQPNGIEIECFVTGDEYYNWLHDKDGYTIVQNETTGYYCYAILVGDSLVTSPYIVGVVYPQSVNLEPYANISAEKISGIVNEIISQTPQKPIFNKSSQKAITQINTGTINNIVIYIKFADQTEFEPKQNTYTNMFNSINNGYNSMRNYFREASYNKLNIISHFYPTNNGTVILSYQDANNRGYYCPYDSKTNPAGYCDGERNERENTLLCNAVNFVKNQIPILLNIDYNEDGYVDNVCFIIRGNVTGGMLNPSRTILYPHKSWLSVNSNINGKRVWDYNIQLDDDISRQGQGNGVLCHEMFHTLGAHITSTPDLYHGKKTQPVGHWDLMGKKTNPPQHMGAYMKYKYGKWISAIPTITTSGTYTLQPLTSQTNNCYKIPIGDSYQYLVVEYRKKTGTFESNIPGSGMIIYRINDNYHGNGWGGEFSWGKTDEVYVFRPDFNNSEGHCDSAYFSEKAGRTVFNNLSNPYCFTTPNKDYGDLYIRNIRENSNGTLSFYIGFCSANNNPITNYLNTNLLPALTNSHIIKTQGSIVVKSNDNVIFEAKDEVAIYPGFEVQLGGKFEVFMTGCGMVE
jgi:M6 family metalloprotease-like protein